MAGLWITRSDYRRDTASQPVSRSSWTWHIDFRIGVRPLTVDVDPGWAPPEQEVDGK
jgi:hypothetical protein